MNLKKVCYLILIILVTIKVGAITCQKSASTWSALLSVLAKISGSDPSTSSGYASAKVSSTPAGETICPISTACVKVGSQYESGGYCGILISDPHASKSFYPQALIHTPLHLLSADVKAYPLEHY